MEVTDKQMYELEADIKTGEEARDMYRQQAELIDQALNSEGEMDMYDLYQSSKYETAESEGDVKKRRTRARIKLQDVGGLSEVSLGKIQVLDEFDLNATSTPVLCQTLDCTSEEDHDMPVNYDVLKMEMKGSTILIVTDYMNMCIKTFNRRQKQLCRLALNSFPGTMAKLENNKIGVCFPHCKQIVFVSVTRGLTVDSTITTQKRYRGLTAPSPTTLAACCESPSCVDILDRSGIVMRSINPKQNGQDIIQTPFFMCSTRQGNILLSDTGTKSVMCLTPEGDVVFNYCPTGDRALKDPQGVTITAAGHILVTDFWGMKVIQLNESGEFVRDLLEQVLRKELILPFGIDWDEKGEIYLTSMNCDLMVFSFKRSGQVLQWIKGWFQK